MEPAHSDFLLAFGQEVCWALSPPVPFDRIVPQDGFEVWLRAFGEAPSAETLMSLSEAQLEHLRSECEHYFECPTISTDQLRCAIARTLTRWPARVRLPWD
jgi:hypothetical protein